MKSWKELSRTEKIRDFFHYPESARDELAQDLWGPKAYACQRSICFPKMTPWEEIVTIMRSANDYQSVFLPMKESDFSYATLKELEEIDSKKGSEVNFQLDPRYRREEYNAFTEWRERMLSNPSRKKVEVELYDEKRILCRVCTSEGDYGDEQGFGMEPDLWASALLDLKGNIILPFRPGYILKPAKKKKVKRYPYCRK